jgi:Transglutaminase-like superfamily/Coenzyme PQQ synthesis protein D (PqqD)
VRRSGSLGAGPLGAGSVRLLDDLVIADKPSGSVVLHLRKGVYFELDRSATEVVKLVRSSGATATAATLADRHDIPVEVVARDVERVLGTIRDAVAVPAARARHPSWRSCAKVAQHWFALPLGQKYDTIYASTLVMSVEVLLRCAPLDRVSRWLRSPLTDPFGAQGLPPLGPSSLTSRERRLLSALASAQRRWLWDATCLRRALASGWVLRRHQPKLCLGLASSNDNIAHAWLVVDGQTLDDLPGATPFRPLAPVLG